MKTLQLGSLLCVAAILATDLVADEPADPGLAVGQTAPSFALKDQTGKEVALPALLKKGPVAVVFHRSADWCLYCKLQMVQLQKSLKEIESSGGQIVGISYDSTKALQDFARRSDITFPLLADEGSKTIDAFAIRNLDVPEKYEGVAYHATFIVDQKGIIRSKLYQVSYQERPAVEALVTALKEAQGASPAGATSENLSDVSNP